MTTEAIAALADETHALLENFNAAMRTAQTHHDPDLNFEALQRKRDELITTARAEAEEKLSSIQEKVQQASAAADKNLQAGRPRIPSEPAALIEAEQAWNYDIKPILEAGGSLKAIIREADVTTLLSIERFGRGYLQAAKVKAGEGPGNPMELRPEELQDAVNNRLAVTLPEDQRAGFEDSVRASDAADRLLRIFPEANETIRGNVLYNFSAGAKARSLAIKLRD